MRVKFSQNAIISGFVAGRRIFYFFVKMDNDDDDDEWFFNSFKRYNELQMFDFPNPVSEIDLTSTNNLCVALDGDGKNRNEVLILFLPSSLHTNKSIEGLKLDRHLSFDQGYFTTSRLSEVKCISNEEKLFINEKDGIALYDIGCSDSDIIKKLTDIPCDLADVRLAVNGPHHLVAYSGVAISSRKIVDYKSVNTVLNINDERLPTENPTSPFFSSSQVISFGDNITGLITSYDIRDGKRVITMGGSGTAAHWCFDTMFDIKRQTVADTNEVFSFSSNGNFLVYDARNPSNPVIKCEYKFCSSSSDSVTNLRMNVCPANTSIFSVCGFDQNLYVCEVSNDTINVIFTHDGHSYNEEEMKPNVRTKCSLWLPFVSANTVISCADDSSVQCWQFKTS